MGIKTETTTTVTCDFCDKQLHGKPEKEITIFYRQGYECNTEINIKIEATMQWQPEQIVCKECLIKYMKQWIKRQEDGI
ncbi:hypothetical protein DES39_0514 [Orbus hercynius]|uniref:Uncharacterized protein n=1 Tax=Orbus hercynius TaxID=593135 RepID=A0A495RJ35_9GAMM|nr:hypothetical protein [Orbus hercynius]RKS87294.1 hypothetical protein DES39_0514 [Orbus hercynius]